MTDYADIYPTDAEQPHFQQSSQTIYERARAYLPIPPTELGEAIRLSSPPIKLAAYRVACGERTRAQALAVGEIHHDGANGSILAPEQIEKYIDLLIEAYSAAAQ